MRHVGHVGHRAADALQHVDRRIVIPRAEVAREHDVAVEDRADRVGDRLVVVVAVDEHGVDRGDAAAAAHVAGAFEQRRQQREHRRRIALGRRRLAGGQTDFALRHREARHRIHHQQDVLAPGRGSTRRSSSRHRRRACAAAAGCPTSRPRPRDRSRPAGPRSCSRKPRTSRPRSPTSASTTTSAAVPRAIMPSSVLLPTPLPPNSPMRWPRPQVSSASMARTPVRERRRRPARASSGLSGGGSSGTCAVGVERPARRAAGRGRRRRGRAAPGRRRTDDRAVRERRCGRRAGCRRCRRAAPSAAVPSRKPTTCTGSDGAPLERRSISQISPTRARGPPDSISRPTTRMTRPSAAWSRCRRPR